MKRNKIILVFLIVLTAASLFALSACNESGTDGGKTPTLKYPMSQLPTDLLEPQDYLKVSDSYADGYRKFEFTFDEMTAAGKEKTRLGDDLYEKGYERTASGAETVYTKDDTEIKLRQSSSSDGSSLFISIPYEYTVTNLPTSLWNAPLFDGKAFNAPKVTSDTTYTANTVVTISIDYFETTYEQRNAFDRYIELNKYDVGKSYGLLNVVIETSAEADNHYTVRYKVDRFGSETAWKQFVSSATGLDYQKNILSPVKFDVGEYDWIGAYLKLAGYEDLLAKPSGMNVSYSYRVSDNYSLTSSDYATVCEIVFSDITKSQAVSYINSLVSSQAISRWQDTLYIDGTAMPVWQDIKSNDTFTAYLRFKLILGEFAFDGTQLKVTLERISPSIDSQAVENSNNDYQITFIDYDKSEAGPYTAKGDDWVFSLWQNGAIVKIDGKPGYCASPIYDSFEMPDFSERFSAHLHSGEMLMPVGKDSVADRSVSVFETDYMRYFVDTSLNLCLKIERINDGGEDELVFAVTEFKTGKDLNA